MSCRKTEIFTNKYKLVHGKVTDLKDMLIWNLDELYLKYYNESNSMLKNTNYQWYSMVWNYDCTIRWTKVIKSLFLWYHRNKN